MKVIDLLNKIANSEEVPKKIKYNLLEKKYQILVYDEEEQEYRYENDYNNFCTFPNHHLNDEVEITEEKKVPLKINKIVPSQNYVISDSKNYSVDERLEIIRKSLYANELYMLDIANTLNEIIDVLEILNDKIK